MTAPTPTVQGVTAEEVDQDDRFAREFREAVRVAGVHGSMEPYARILSGRLRQMDKRAKAANKAISELREQTKLDVGLARAATEAAEQRASAARALATQTAESNERLRADARFLVNRLNDLDDDCFTEDGIREFHGHVFPSMSRLRALLSDLKTETDGAGALEPLTRTEQILQAYRCSCRGTDDLCPCQNAPDQQTRTTRRALASETGGRDE